MREKGIKKAVFFLGTLQRFIKQKELMQKADISPIYLILPAILSLAAAFFEAVSMALLIPLLRGIIEMNFGFVRELPVLKDIIAAYPQLFITPNSSVFIFLLIIIFTTVIIKNTFIYFSALSMDYQYRRYASNMRKIIMSRYLSFGKLFFDRNSRGNLFNTLVYLTNFAADQIRCLHGMIKWSLLIVAYLTLMSMISWKLTFCVLIIFPFTNCSLSWILEKIRKTSKYFVDSKQRLSAKLYNVLSCIPLIQLYKTEQKERKSFDYTSDQVAAFEFSIDKKERLLEPLHEIIMLGMILLLMSIMAYFIIRHRSGGLSGFLVYFYILRRLGGTLNNLSLENGKFAKTAGPFNEVMHVFDNRGKYFIIEGKKEFGGLKEKIEYDRINFSYIPEVQVLKGVAFSIEKAKMTAIVGPTGGGKTTLAHLLLRFYDCPPSSIMVDGTDIREFTLKSLRSHMALVSQETLLFNDTLRSNITYGIDKVEEEALIDIVKKAKLYDFIMKLPDGFDTLIGDRGVKLSGGEKQRVAIARALLKGSEILILDEATSSLDSITERLIQGAIDEVVKGKTAIVIAHRLSTIKNADKIIVIEDGKLAEEGTLEALLEKKGRFYKYWCEQKFS